MFFGRILRQVYSLWVWRYILQEKSRQMIKSAPHVKVRIFGGGSLQI